MRWFSPHPERIPRMPSKILSTILLISCVVITGLIGHYVTGDQRVLLVFAVGGLAIGAIVIRLLKIWVTLDVYRIIGGAVGIFFGASLSLIAELIITTCAPKNEVTLLTGLMMMIISCLVCMQLGATKAKDFRRKPETPTDYRKVVGILDTSVIIDGRIADVCETGFLDGDIVIPQFVLKELQMIADSSEATKRTRGRRGLDILNKIKKQPFVKICIDDTDYPSIKEVDQKLIHMAKESGWSILTNDFNLNKVAEVQSIQVLNINQLANSLKPIVLPGETMKVQVIKEGKEPGQGIAYLDDGTMVVVDNGRRAIGKNIEVTVTSVLQTTAGRMIFAVTKN